MISADRQLQRLENIIRRGIHLVELEKVREVFESLVEAGSIRIIIHLKELAGLYQAGDGEGSQAEDA